jgi:hypothetical protein
MRRGASSAGTGRCPGDRRDPLRIEPLDRHHILVPPRGGAQDHPHRRHSELKQLFRLRVQELSEEKTIVINLYSLLPGPEALPREP